MTPNEKKIDRVFADAVADAAKEDGGFYGPPAIRRMAKGPHRYAAAIELDFTHLNGRRGYWDRTGRMQGVTVRLGIPSYGEEDEEYAQNCLDTMVGIAEKLGIPVKRSYKRLQSTIHGPIYNCYVVVPQYEPQADTEPEASDEVDEAAISAINENTKVTLTLKQIKKLVKESNNDEFSHWFEIALKNLKNRVADLEEVFSSVKKGDVTPADADKLTDFVYDTEKNLKFMLKLLGKVKGSEVKEGIDDEDDEGPADVDTAVEDLFDMYRACKVEPKVCNAIKADGEKTSIFLDKGNSVGGVARALRDGRLLKVIGFN